MVLKSHRESAPGHASVPSTLCRFSIVPTLPLSAAFHVSGRRPDPTSGCWREQGRHHRSAHLPAGGRRQKLLGSRQNSIERRIAMDAVTPKGADRRHAFPSRSPDRHGVAEDPLPGCEAKTLLFDRKTGLMTALMRFAPGAVLPDHEHVNIEQTYVLEGSPRRQGRPGAGHRMQGRRIHLARAGQPPCRLVSAGRADARDLPGPEQVLRGRRPRRSTPRARIGTRPGGTHRKGWTCRLDCPDQGDRLPWRLAVPGAPC